MTSQITDIIYSQFRKDANITILLQDKDRRIVAAIYPNKLDIDRLTVISETNNTEKYMFYYEGIGIYFTYYRICEGSAK